MARGEAAVAKGTALGPLPAARARVLAARLTEDGLSPAGGGRGRGSARTQSREQGGQGSASGRYKYISRKRQNICIFLLRSSIRKFSNY